MSNYFEGKIDTLDKLLVEMVRMGFEEADHRHCAAMAPREYTSTSQQFGPVGDENFWKYREYLRLNKNPEVFKQLSLSALTELPISGTPCDNPNHFLHVALGGESAMVAYTESDDKGRRDIQTRTKFGKYLNKFYADYLDNEQIKKAVATFEYQFGKAPELHISDKAEDFVRAIQMGPSESCMSDGFYSDRSDKKFNYQGHSHPAVCYASGDIEVLWIECDGRVTARCLANKETKDCTRIYGDMNKMLPLMEAAGYTQSGGALDGCRLLVIKNEGGDGWLMPYVDRGTGSGGGSMRARFCTGCWMLVDTNDNDIGSELVNTYKGYENRGIVTETTGEDEEPEFGHCDCCGDGIHSDDNYSYSEHHEARYCTSCADRCWVWAIVSARSATRYDSDHVNQGDCTYIEAISEWVLDDMDFSYLELVQDEYSDEWIKQDDAVLDVDGCWTAQEDCTDCGENDDGTIWVHDTEIAAQKRLGHLYSEVGTSNLYWYESDEIVAWLEDNDGEPDRYDLCRDADAVMAKVLATPEEVNPYEFKVGDRFEVIEGEDSFSKVGDTGVVTGFDQVASRCAIVILDRYVAEGLGGTIDPTKPDIYCYVERIRLIAEETKPIHPYPNAVMPQTSRDGSSYVR